MFTSPGMNFCVLTVKERTKVQKQAKTEFDTQLWKFHPMWFRPFLAPPTKLLREIVFGSKGASASGANHRAAPSQSGHLYFTFQTISCHDNDKSYIPERCADQNATNCMSASASSLQHVLPKVNYFPLVRELQYSSIRKSLKGMGKDVRFETHTSNRFSSFSTPGHPPKNE
eukprot:4561078-Amphidinium_carterae.1